MSNAVEYILQKTGALALHIDDCAIVPHRQTHVYIGDTEYKVLKVEYAVSTAGTTARVEVRECT